ncbi:ABC transporter ATP-binding protein [Serratia oryzae]|uniref:Sugar ABC transporter ATP-binding protein n=1 Tax=Serratia oryzae TaxID=2034155 RepID=A0A1S8CLC8_9GAMM|nr:sn-glycerol-3-phosphate ABC transporter ATP-binding protein UgpC [Serratia oryzae]OMQ23768.1 sugar ABC transporter ATP-binding protein [Serratia oryzae]VXD01560.1 fused maltose transport subunit, ATP-binding component of ABC superfamily; regulatory protein [Enterobacterales bacterium 8AC]
MASVSLTNVVKNYGKIRIIDNVNLEINAREFIVLVGPSGCGKSTLLRMIAGLEEVSSGEIKIGNKDVTHMNAGERGVSMVFQSYALYPHMTVRENLAFGLKNIKTPKPEIATRIANAANILQLNNYLERLPQHLSGGQRQRVAIGRSIVSCANVLLFDEPLSNLDAALRIQMRQEIGKLHERLGKTTIYVTHDQTEAMTLADRIVILNQGKIEQVGTPEEVYNHPANIVVAGFIGAPKINLFNVVYEQAGRVTINGQSILIPHLAKTELPAGTTLTLGIRPEHFSLTHGAELCLKVKTELTEMHGDSTVALFHSAAHGALQMKVPYQLKLAAGEEVTIGTAYKHILVFDQQGQAIRGEAP